MTTSMIQPRRLSAGVLPLASASFATPAVAQIETPATIEIDEEDRAKEVTVIGVRQAYRGNFALSEIPQSIAEIDAETLGENNILRLTDALDLNASVVRQNTLGGLWDSFAVRGFSATRICRAVISLTASMAGVGSAGSETWQGASGSRC